MYFHGIFLWEKEFKVYDVKTRDIIMSDEVILHEKIFPFTEKQVDNETTTIKFVQQGNLFIKHGFDVFVRPTQPE